MPPPTKNIQEISKNSEILVQVCVTLTCTKENGRRKNIIKKKCLDHLADDVPVNTGQREKKKLIRVSLDLAGTS